MSKEEYIKITTIKAIKKQAHNAALDRVLEIVGEDEEWCGKDHCSHYHAADVDRNELRAELRAAIEKLKEGL